MKIKHKYLRNRNVKIKQWKRICRLFNLNKYSDYKILKMGFFEAVNERKKILEKYVRALESGTNFFYNSPSHFKRILNKKRKAKERNIIKKIRNGNYEAEDELSKFRKNANWLYL
jgi:hypothetical protein